VRGAGAPDDASAPSPAPLALAPPPAALGPDPAPASAAQEAKNASLWTLAVLTLCYMHASACAYALPALLPDVAAELSLDDGQSASLTFAFTLTYSLLLIPAGAAADAVDRRALLAAGVGLWSGGTALAGLAPSYPTLLASRLLYAAGYAVQNPVCFAIIPELFPRSRASAMAAYNVAIHLGRAISFGGGALASPAAAARAAEAAAAAPQLQLPAGAQELPLEALAGGGVAALGGLTILYLSADALVLSPPGGGGSGIDAQLPGALAGGAHAAHHALSLASAAGLDWRGVLVLLASPGPLLLVPLLLFTVRDPGRLGAQSRAARRRGRGGGPASAPPWGETIRAVVSSSPWRLATAAAVLNDFGAWALVVRAGWAAPPTTADARVRALRASKPRCTSATSIWRLGRTRWRSPLYCLWRGWPAGWEGAPPATAWRRRAPAASAASCWPPATPSQRPFWPFRCWPRTGG